MGELQGMREKVGVMEEKMDTIILDRLLDHEAAVCSRASCWFMLHAGISNARKCYSSYSLFA